jgi:Pyruvate/2-oxoacid:ferredoxin oxidoreductase delta subunit
MACICRRAKELLGGKCEQTDMRDNCLTFGWGAKLCVDNGAARYISREEMLELINAADKEGLVLQPENTKRPHFVCCCCGCCCQALRGAKRFPRPVEYFTSNFFAVVDTGTCGSCGTCQSRCPMQAISDDSNDGKAKIDLSRCVGCGLCVTTCPTGALRLQAKESSKTVPDDTQALYAKLLEERYGTLDASKMVECKQRGIKV